MSAQASLVYEVEDGSRQDLRLNPSSKATIGRHPQCTLFINQPSVSRRHARLTFEKGVWIIEDLKSSNGTFVNDLRIEKQELNEGDVLRCGDFSMTYLVEDRTREVGDIGSVAPAPKIGDGAQPRLVGSLSQAKNSPSVDAAIIERPTIGIQESVEVTHSPNPSRAEAIQLNDANVRIGTLESKLAAANEELQNAKREAAALRDQVKVHETDSKAQQARVSELESELELSTQNQINNASDDELIDHLAEVYEDLDTYTSEVKLKLKLSSGLVEDLKPVVALVETLHNEKLPKAYADKVRTVVEDTDAADTMVKVQTTFAEAEKAARATRRMIRLFREVLKQHTDG